MLDDLLATGVVAPYAQGALFYSEAADIWFGTSGKLLAAKRALYIALRHAGVPLDVIDVIDADVVSGALNQYSSLYSVDALVPELVMRAASRWVHGGGKLVLTRSPPARRPMPQRDQPEQRRAASPAAGAARGWPVDRHAFLAPERVDLLHSSRSSCRGRRRSTA
jgi:hypothetical protein